MKEGERPGGPDQALRPRERLLGVAIRLFLEEGIRAVGVHRIVDEAGVAPMTLYRHFGGKEGLVVAALEQWSAESIGVAGGPGGPVRGTTRRRGSAVCGRRWSGA
jgi:AcrR family transcriptional regulator